jgi:hypothetical protein
VILTIYERSDYRYDNGIRINWMWLLQHISSMSAVTAI